MSFCFYRKKYTNFYFMTNEPTLIVCAENLLYTRATYAAAALPPIMSCDFAFDMHNISTFICHAIWQKADKLRTCICMCCLPLLIVNNDYFLQRVGIACYADGCISYGRVRLSVCLSSVTRWYCVEKNEATIMRFSPTGRTFILISGEVKIVWNFAGDHP